MKCKVLIACLMLMIVVSSVTARCGRRLSSCTTSGECCSKYCRGGQCINFGDSADDVGQDPCDPSPCLPGQCCERQQVQCVRFPCPPVANCVDH